MIIRELISKFGFSVDSASLKKAENSIDNVKKKLASVRAPKGGIMINDVFYKGGQFIPKGLWEHVENGTANVNKNLNQIGNSAESAGSRIKEMVHAYLTFASVTTIARVADAAQNLRARLAMVPQTVGDAGAAFDEIVKRANFARTSIDAYGQLYVRIAGSTKDYLKTQEDVLEVTDAISQALTINGATAQEAASVTLQLSQAFQQGYLNGEEFNAFITGTSIAFREQMVVALREVTGNTNITLAGLRKMSERGELYARDLALAFKKMAPEIRKQMLSIPLTIGGATQIVRNDFIAMIDRMNRESMAVTRIAGTIVKGFELIERAIYQIARSPEFKFFTEKLSQGFNLAKDAIREVVNALGGFENAVRLSIAALTVLIGSKIIKGIRAIAAAGVLAASSWLKMAAVVVVAALVMEDVFRAINGQASATGALIDKIVNSLKSAIGFLDEIASKTVGQIQSGKLFIARTLGLDEVGGGNFSSPRAVDPRVIEQAQVMSWLARRASASNVAVTINVDVPPGTPESQAQSIATIAGDALSRYITNVAGGK